MGTKLPFCILPGTKDLRVARGLASMLTIETDRALREKWIALLPSWPSSRLVKINATHYHSPHRSSEVDTCVMVSMIWRDL